MRSIRKGPVTIFLLLIAFALSAQKAQKEIKSGELDQVRNMISFLEFMLNTLGSNKTSARDKDVVITESYLKIFRDNRVQIEDDLDTRREVITNKNAPAYLKDVDFFFRDVKFEFTIEDITIGEQSDKNTFYKVSLLRNLRGITLEGEPINNTTPRFVEINYDAKNRDLKIVSIYTNELDETAVLTYWWNELSYEWQSIFKRKLNIVDSVRLGDLKKITTIESLDLSANKFILDIGALTQLYNLKTLNLAETAIADLNPIRNLTELTELDLSGTPVKDLSSLRYCSKLEKLSLDHTRVDDISIVEKMPNLVELNLAGTNATSYEPLATAVNLQRLRLQSSSISNLQPLAALLRLEELDLSATKIVNVNSLAGLQHITSLKLDSTRIADISALNNLKRLTALYLNHTLVADLSALADLPLLTRVYCDHSGITRNTAEIFMVSNPEVLVIFDSEDLNTWWATLSAEWQQLLQKVSGCGTNPSKEELARITKLDSINLSNHNITTLDPLKRLGKLEVIIASGIPVSDLAPLALLADITYLDLDYTAVDDLRIVNQLKKIKVLRATGTAVRSLDDLKVPSLEKLYVDHTGVDDRVAEKFLLEHPSCVIVYKTARLEKWWNDLSRQWQGIFKAHLRLKDAMSPEMLHQLVEGERLSLNDKPVSDLLPLREFIRLREFHFSGTAITDLSGLERFDMLQSLHATRSPLRNVSALLQLVNLEDLNLSDTPLQDLSVIGELVHLKSFDCSGTQVRKLNELAYLSSLETLNCANTVVRNLDPVSALPLRSLTCYNTKVSEKRLEVFRARNPECDVVYYR